MAEVNFTSRFVPVTGSGFINIISQIERKNLVDYPWTLKESVLAKDTYTKGISDCSAALFTNGSTSFLMHLCPDTSAANANENRILQFLKERLNLNDKYLQAVLAGSQKQARSRNVYSALKNVIEKLGIPLSELETGKAPTNIAYRTIKDEIYITNKAINDAIKNGASPKDSLSAGFEKIIIADCDEI